MDRAATVQVLREVTWVRDPRLHDVTNHWYRPIQKADERLPRPEVT
jgi:hypothetical protein